MFKYFVCKDFFSVEIEYIFFCFCTISMVSNSNSNISISVQVIVFLALTCENSFKNSGLKQAGSPSFQLVSNKSHEVKRGGLLWATCQTGMHYMDPRSFPRRCSSYGLSERVLHDCPAETQPECMKVVRDLISFARLRCFNRGCPARRGWKTENNKTSCVL